MICTLARYCRYLAVIAAATLGLAACGGGGGSSGGGGGGGNTISISTQSLSFDVAQNEVPAGKTVTITFSGAGAAVGTLPGQTVPSWITVGGLTLTSSTQATVSIGVAPGAIAPGNYSTTLRMATANADLSHAAYADLTVTMAVRQGLAVTSSPAPSFSLVEGSSVSVPTALTLSIAGSGTQWTVTQKPAWLDLSASSGSGPGVITATLNAAARALPAQSNPLLDSVAVLDSVTGIQAGIGIQLQVNRVLPTLTPNALSFSVDASTTDAQLSQTVQISDTALGQNTSLGLAWTSAGDLYPDQTSRLPEPPFTASVRSGSTIGAATNVTVALRRQVLSGLLPGIHQLSLVFHFVSPDISVQNVDVVLPVSLTVRLPRAGTAIPAVIASGTPGTVQLSGDDFEQVDLSQLRVNGAPAPTGSAVSLTDSHTLNLTLPALAAGRYTIDFANALTLRRSYAEIQAVVPVSAAGTGSISALGAPYYRLIYDDARRRLYGQPSDLTQVARYQWDGSAWQALAPISLVGPGVVALGRNGREIYVSTSTGIWAQDVDTGAVNSQVAGPAIATCSGSPLWWLVSTRYGSLQATDPACALAAGNLSEFDLISGLAGPPVQSGYSYRSYPLSPDSNSEIGTSPDGRYVLSLTAGGFVVLDTVVHQYVAPQAGSSHAGGSNSGSQNFVGADSAGQVLLLRNGVVADRSGTALGILPAHNAAVLRNDGMSAVILVYDGQGASHLAVVNLSSAVGALNTFPQMGSNIPVSPSLGRLEGTGYSDQALQLALSADGHTAFVSGPGSVAAVAVP